MAEWRRVLSLGLNPFLLLFLLPSNAANSSSSLQKILRYFSIHDWNRHLWVSSGLGDSNSYLCWQSLDLIYCISSLVRRWEWSYRMSLSLTLRIVALMFILILLSIFYSRVGEQAEDRRERVPHGQDGCVTRGKRWEWCCVIRLQLLYVPSFVQILVKGIATRGLSISFALEKN